MAGVGGDPFLAALGADAGRTAGAAFVVALDVREALSAAPTGPAGDAAGSATLARPVAAVPGFVERVVRRLTAAPVAWSSMSADEAPADAATAPGSARKSGETATPPRPSAGRSRPWPRVFRRRFGRCRFRHDRLGTSHRVVGPAAACPGHWLLGNLRPEQRFELRGHVAPGLACIARRRCDVALRTAVTAIAMIRACGSRPAADVRVAIDPAPTTATTPDGATTTASATTATTTPAVALALHRRLIGGPAATGTATAAAASAPPLFGDQVFGDLRFIEVLVVADRRDRSSRRRRGRTQL